MKTINLILLLFIGTTLFGQHWLVERYLERDTLKTLNSAKEFSADFDYGMTLFADSVGNFILKSEMIDVSDDEVFTFESIESVLKFNVTQIDTIPFSDNKWRYAITSRSGGETYPIFLSYGGSMMGIYFPKSGTMLVYFEKHVMGEGYLMP